MPTWQNLLSWIKRHCHVHNLSNVKLVCCVLLQVSIFILALSFAIYVHTRDYRDVNLPSSAARAVIDNQHATNYVVTLVAGVMASLNTILLGFALRLDLIARMNHPVSLQNLRGSISLITGQPLIGARGLRITWAWIKSLQSNEQKDIAPGDMKYLTWLTYTLMYSLLCGPLTSSWSSFLAPTFVERQFKFRSYTAVDYFALQAIWNGYVAPYPSESSPLVTYMNVTRVLAGVEDFGFSNVSYYTQAGSAAASSKLGSPIHIPDQGVLFYGVLYNGSTGGVFINASTMTQNASSIIPPQYRTWTKNYTTFQQGLSADVQCRQQTFVNATDTYPNMNYIAPNLGVLTDYGYSMQRYMITTNCASDSVAYTNDILALVDQNGYPLGDGPLIGSVCKYQDFEKATNQSFLVLLQGFPPLNSVITPTICQVSPRITYVNVGFDGTTANISDPTKYEPLDPEGQQAAYIDQISDLIWTMIFDTQSLSGNSMATGVRMISDGDSLNFVLENYLRGVVEFLGTVWQSNLQSNNTFMIPYHATIHVESRGYDYRKWTDLFLLVPLAVVTIFTCVAAVYTPASKPKWPDVSVVKDEMIQENMDSPDNPAPRSTIADSEDFDPTNNNPAPRSTIADSEDFDPTNIIHLMMLGSKFHLENKAGENERLRFHLD